MRASNWNGLFAAQRIQMVQDAQRAVAIDVCIRVCLSIGGAIVEGMVGTDRVAIEGW